MCTEKILQNKKLSKLELTESEYRFKTLVESAKEMIFNTDIKGYIAYANPTTLKVLNLDYTNSHDIHFTKLIRPDWVKKNIKLLCR